MSPRSTSLGRCTLFLCLAAALVASCGEEDRAGPPKQDASSGGSSGTAGQAGTGAGAGQGGDASLDAVAEVGSDASSEGGITPGPVDGSACQAVIEEHVIVPTNHVDTCSYLTFSTNPPSSGPHYGTWPAYGTYVDPVPRGFSLHALEHGAIVFSYNCPSGCAAEVAQAQALIDALPTDPLCVPPDPPRRVILTPDPKLDVKWAAASWGWTLKASCLEPALFSAFYLARFGQGPEQVCADGTPLNVDGGLFLPANCGEADAGAADAAPD